MLSSGDVCCYEVGRISLLMGNIQHMNGWLDLILKVYSNNTLLCTSQVLVISLMFTTEYTCVGGVPEVVDSNLTGWSNQNSDIRKGLDPRLFLLGK